MANDVQVVTLTEDELFRISDYVDGLLERNQRFNNEGVLLFDVADNAGKGTTLEEFLPKFKDEVGESVKRLNPICVPHSKNFYGHMSFSSNLLDQEEVSHCINVLNEQTEYIVSGDNCCISALNESGTSGLAAHYFDEVLPKESSHPPQFRRMESLNTLRKTATLNSKSFRNLNKMLDSMTSAEKSAKLSRLLDSSKHRPQANICSCWMCVYSDEVFVKEDEENPELKPDIQRTADYYKGKGFMYGTGVGVEADKRNMISSHFSLSYVNSVTLTGLLGYYPGIDNPYLYFGFKHSFFPIHIEDLSLWSINFIHHGYPKLWVVVSPSSVGKLNFFLSKEFTCPGHAVCIGLLGHKYHVPTPSWLRKKDIPFKLFVQKAGQGIIVAPNAAHFGYNLGQNVAEAVNFGSPSWIPYGIMYPKCTCIVGQVHADLSTVICTFSPEMLDAYRHRKLPKVTSQRDFCKRIISPNLWEESPVGGYTEEDSRALHASDDVRHKNDCQLRDTSAAHDEDGSTTHSSEIELRPKPKRLKSGPNRKVLKCPVCEAIYQGGQKQRLFNHISKAHPNLPAEEKKRVDDLLTAMFPVWGSALPKKTCDRCGKAVARSLKSHQNSSACKQSP